MSVASELPSIWQVESEPFFGDGDTLDGFSQRGVGLTGEVDGHILLYRQDTQLKLGTVGRKSPKPHEEGASVIEVVGHQLAVGIQTGAIAVVADGEQSAPPAVFGN